MPEAESPKEAAEEQGDADIGGGELHHRRPQTVCAFQIETRACDVQSWETKDCVQSGRTHLKKELRSPNSKPFGKFFFKCEHDAGHAAQSAGS